MIDNKLPNSKTNRELYTKKRTKCKFCNKITKWEKNSLDGLKSRLDSGEEKITNLKERAIERNYPNTEAELGSRWVPQSQWPGRQSSHWSICSWSLLDKETGSEAEGEHCKT